MSTDTRDDLSPGATSRQLVRTADRAVLATLRHTADGWPYASLVLVACDHDASPILLISGLADHTRNILADERVSLLYDGTGGLADPLAGARVSLQGRARRTEDERHARRYLRRHPSAEGYAGFGDFSFWRVAIESAHLVAGFGRIHWVDRDDIRFETAGLEALAEAEEDIVAHMNQDHADAVALYARFLLGRRDGPWRMTGIDPEGCDLRLDGETGRVAFASTVGDAGAARQELVRLTRLARSG